MRDRFHKCLEGLLPEGGGAVLLAVSGGVDSMVMADLFLKCLDKSSITLAHCNFHLRGKESDGDEAFVREWAGNHGLAYRKADFDTVGYAKSHGLSVEMAARELRYGWFASLCGTEGYRAVAVAHNANDNAETLILNLLRGTGLKGLCGMRESSLLPGSEALLIRPMLSFSRAEILEYARSQGIHWREDSTNSDSAYKRNLIRNEVFPHFEKVNPAFLETLASDMRHFSQVQAIADDFVAANLPEAEGFAPYPGKWSAVGTSPSAGVISVKVDDLSRLPHWEYLLFRLLEPFGFNEAVIGDMVELIKSGKTFSGKEFRSATHVARTSRNSITLEALSGKGRTADLEDDSIEVTGAGEYVVGGVGFEVEVAEIEDLKQPEGVTVVNLSFPFTVRPWIAGDWMRPLGMKGRKKKLSDMFNDLKFSREQKDRALVIAGEGSHVLALLGYRVDISIALTALRQVGELVEPQGPIIRIRII